MTELSGLTVRNLKVNEDKLIASFDRGIFATDAAINLVAGGMSFRDAYREVGTHPEKYPAGDPREAILSRSSSGTAGNLKLDVAEEILTKLTNENESREAFINKAFESLAGRPVAIV